MFKRISILILICFANLQAFTQTAKYTAPVKWERYKVSNHEVSVLLPKLPVLVEEFNSCNEQKTDQYAVYADQTVYGFNIVSKRKEKTPEYCTEKKEFSEKSFANRLAAIKTEMVDAAETNFKQNDLIFNKFSGKTKTFWLINDFNNERWFEFWFTGGNEEKTEIQKFISSVEISENTQGIEIGKGAARAFGDDNVKDFGRKDVKNIGKTNTGTMPVIIALKSPPKYMEAARKADTQGTVKLKVVFMANGGIGDITVVDGLPNGLTEQAVEAAQRLVFIPAQRKGVPYDVAKTITYSFTIY